MKQPVDLEFKSQEILNFILILNHYMIWRKILDNGMQDLISS